MEKFYLKPTDEFFSIIDNLKLSKELNLVLIIPSGTNALRSIINLRILKEECSFLGKNIYISTSDELIKKLAGQVKIKILEPQKPQIIKKPIAKSMGRIVDLRGIKDIKKPVIETDTEEEFEIPENLKSEFEEPEIKHKEEFSAEPKIEDEFFYKERISEEKIFAEPLPERIQKEREKRHFKISRKKIFSAILIIIGLLALAFVVYFVLPHAQIVINPKKEKVQFETNILVDKDINSTNIETSEIAGQLVETEKMASKEFPSTGEKDVSQKAIGKIIIYNQYSSSPQTLVKTTRLKSKDGKIFRLTSTVTIPGATINEGQITPSTKEVEVEADEAGVEYNIGPADFTIPGFEGTPKYSAFYGKSTQAMSGGAKGKMKVATQNDISGAIEIVKLELKDVAIADFKTVIPAGLKLLDDAQVLSVVESSSNLKANQAGEKFIVTVKVKVSGIVFNENDALSLIEKNVGDKIPQNRTLLFSTIKTTYKTIKLDLKQGSLNLDCSVEAESVVNFEEQKIKKDLAGKNEDEVKTYLSSLPDIETAKVIFWPFWVKKVPKNQNKIKVTTKIN
ncbi:MAG TPA: hypothetical protein PLF70_01640 [Candidatus Portnoybacteria bacterium]|nr:hypothetical protein [Candidatus Portnoybacteria bacterium]